MKTPEMEAFLDRFTKKCFGTSRQDGICVTCGSTKVSYEDFRDDLSRREYDISKMCQECQNSVFDGDEDDE